MNHDLSFFIDSDKYPLCEASGELYRLLVAEARAAIHADGCYVLKSAIKPHALAQMQE